MFRSANSFLAERKKKARATEVDTPKPALFSPIEAERRRDLETLHHILGIAAYTLAIVYYSVQLYRLYRSKTVA